MTYYIKIDNPTARKPAAKELHLNGEPVEGPTKVCLVTAFTSVVGHPHPAYAPDVKNAGKPLGGTEVTLAGQDPVSLPFYADEFEDLVLDAQRKGKIADFSSENWSALVADLAALRHVPSSPAASGRSETVPGTSALDRARTLAHAFRERQHGGGQRRWDFDRAIFNPHDPAFRSLDPALAQWFRDHNIMPVPLDDDAPPWLIKAEAGIAFGEYLLDRELMTRAGPEFHR